MRADLISMRNESASLNISKGGATHLYVDQHSISSSDSNDGFDWNRPLKTIQAALNKAPAWTEIWVKTGTYLENLVLSHENIRIHGVIQDGADRAVVSPLTGVALTLNAGYTEIDGLAFETVDATAIKCNYIGHYLHDLYVKVSNTSGVSCSGIWLNDSDYTRIIGCYLDGDSSSDVLGIRVDGGSVDNIIAGNYFNDWGDNGFPGYAIGINDAQRCAILPRFIDGVPVPNRFISGYIGVYFYVRGSYLGHSVQQNLFAENINYDIYDPNNPVVSGIVLRENCYAYTGWIEDRNHDGRADMIVSAHNNYDYAPLASPCSGLTVPIARLGSI